MKPPVSVRYDEIQSGSLATSTSSAGASGCRLCGLCINPFEGFTLSMI